MIHDETYKGYSISIETSPMNISAEIRAPDGRGVLNEIAYASRDEGVDVVLDRARRIIDEDLVKNGPTQ